MSESKSQQEPLLDPPQDEEGSDIWGIWAVEFLERLSRTWVAWRATWPARDVPQVRQGNSRAYFVLDRETRIVGISREVTVGRPPSEFSCTPSLLKACSAAVLRFTDQSVWRFESPKQANEVAEELLKIGQDIEAARYQQVSSESLERVCRLVSMAVARQGRVEDSSERSHSDTKPPDPSAPPKRTGGRPRVSASEALRRKQLVAKWLRAKAARVSQTEFCGDAGVTLKHLAKCINWTRQRHRRENKS